MVMVCRRGARPEAAEATAGELEAVRAQVLSARERQDEDTGQVLEAPGA
ncbi:hypothetical protein QT196_00270 [Streptomyces sp. P9-2B-2]|nr:hypothetical protein [Streptomyces sp. P9-2B-2]WJY35837.1 hypothetical protein QT196_00270 [Streptomyces sp. P9-2B-2]